MDVSREIDSGRRRIEFVWPVTGDEETAGVPVAEQLPGGDSESPDLASTEAHASQLPAVMSQDEVAAYLGLGKVTLRTLMYRPREPLPFMRTGATRGRVLFSRKLVEAWIERQCQISSASLKAPPMPFRRSR